MRRAAEHRRPRGVVRQPCLAGRRAHGRRSGLGVGHRGRVGRLGFVTTEGFRDILDDPAHVRTEWAQADIPGAIEEHYDRVLVYGHPAVRQRDYVLQKLIAFHHQHQTPALAVQADLRHAAGQSPSWAARAARQIGQLVDHHLRSSSDDGVPEVVDGGLLTRPPLDAVRADAIVAVGWAVRFRWVVIALTLAAFGAAIAAFTQVQQQFFPASNRPELLVTMTLPKNASIAATEAQTERLAWQSEARFRAIFAGAAIGIGISDIHGPSRNSASP